MVQLELEPRYMQPGRFDEIEAARSTILRRKMSGGTRYGEREKNTDLFHLMKPCLI